MAFPIERKLVVAVSSSALFDLDESDGVWVEQGPRAYERYQREHIDDVLDRGVGFPFIRRFLNINTRFPMNSRSRWSSCRGIPPQLAGECIAQ